MGLLIAERIRREAGEEGGDMVLVDSNARAAECARENVRINGFSKVSVELADVYSVAAPSFDVVVANPPYFAGHRIARYFVDTGKQALKRGGSLYVVSKHGEELGAYAAAVGFEVETRSRRGYDITVGRKQG